MVCFLAMCGQTQKQPVEVAGTISPDGNKPAAERRRGLNDRPGGDGGGVDSPAVRGAGTAAAVGVRGYGRGRCLTVRGPPVLLLSMS